MENTFSLTINATKEVYDTLLAMANAKGISVDVMLEQMVLEQRRKFYRLKHLQKFNDKGIKFRFKYGREGVFTYLGWELREYQTTFCSFDGKTQTTTEKTLSPHVQDENGVKTILHRNDWEESIEVIWE